MGILSLPSSKGKTHGEACCGSHKVARVLQEGRVYILDWGKKCILND